MAEICPLNAIHYAPGVDLDAVVAPPYDVIDAEQRAALLARSPHNVVEIDLPVADLKAACSTRRSTSSTLGPKATASG